jgi:uncharacterized protein YbbC (DUF1343 family)
MSIPVRHGMTLGELAHYFNREAHLRAPLTVIAMRGWRRSLWYDQTGLPWVNPSPNLRSLSAATLYPALGLIETTNLSVGRGTPTPFAFIGAPWINGTQLSNDLNARKLAGVRFEPVDFTPSSPYPYGGQQCHGVRILVADRNSLNSPELGIEIASAIHARYGNKFNLAKMDTLLVNRSVLDSLLAGKDPKGIAGDWQHAVRLFAARRKQDLIY